MALKTRSQASLQKQRDGIVQEQVVAGRKFQGVAFSAKPAKVVFADFEVGKTYRKKVVLTNISYVAAFSHEFA